MRTYTLPGPGLWDAKKFAVRYNLNALKPDFYVNGEGLLVVFPALSDDPPIFEQPDPPAPARYAALDAAMDGAINSPPGSSIDPRIKAVLVELRKLI